MGFPGAWSPDVPARGLRPSLKAQGGRGHCLVLERAAPPSTQKSLLDLLKTFPFSHVNSQNPRLKFVRGA